MSVLREVVRLRKPYSADALIVPSFVPPPKIGGPRKAQTLPERRCERCECLLSRYRDEREVLCAPCQRARFQRGEAA